MSLCKVSLGKVSLGKVGLASLPVNGLVLDFVADVFEGRKCDGSEGGMIWKGKRDWVGLEWDEEGIEGR